MKLNASRLFSACCIVFTGVAQAAQFSVAVVPDTQYYAENYPDLIQAQMQWIVDNRETENIVYVATLGDMKDDGECDNIDFGGGETEWTRVRGAYDLIEAPLPGFPNGVPYGVLPGNHDFDVDPVSSQCAIGTRLLSEFNSFFGPASFAGSPYYQGPRNPGNNDDNVTTFTGCGVDFVSVNLGFRGFADGTETAWANGVLSDPANAGRLGILTSHGFMQENTPGNNGQFDTFGGSVITALQTNPNFFMMLAAHRRGEAWRQQARAPLPPIQGLMSDYQDMLYPDTTVPVDFGNIDSINDTKPAGVFIPDDKTLADSAFMRIMRFDTVDRTVEVTTFSPRIPPSVTSTFTRPTDLESDNVVVDGTNMSKFTTSKFSFSYEGYVNLPPAADNLAIADSTGGGALIGDTLTGSYSYTDDQDAEGATTQRWLRDGVPIAGATGNTFTLTAADANSDISYEVTAVAAAGPASGCADIATVRVRTPSDVVLVLDRSGSMNGNSAVAGAGSKREAMRDAANLFVDQIAADGVHRLGLVQFNQAVVPFTAPNDFPFGGLVAGADGTAGTSGSAQAAINNITAGGLTDILEGLATGATLLDSDPPENDRRIAVVFTDGRHNSPSTLPDIPNLRDALVASIDGVDPGINFYSIGFGTDVSDAALQEATVLRNGWHVNETDPIIMAKSFSVAAAAVMDAATIVDPVYELTVSGSAVQPVPITQYDKDLTVVVNWDYRGKIRPRTELFAPGGDNCLVDTTAGDIYRAEGRNYTIIKFDLPLDCYGYPRHSGDWRVRVSAPDQAREGMRVNIAAYSATRVRLFAGLQALQSGFSIEGVLQGADLQNATMTAELLSPLPETDDSLAEDKLGSDGGSLPAAKIFPRKSTSIKLATSADGKLRYVGKGKVEVDEFGLFQIRVVATGLDAKGTPLRREAVATLYRPQPRSTTASDWFLILILVIMLIFIGRQIMRDRRPVYSA